MQRPDIPAPLPIDNTPYPDLMHSYTAEP